jgi:hypothetical protein
MNKSFSIATALMLSTLFLGGCSVYSDASQSTEKISAADGTLQYRVKCGGLFGSSSVCVRQTQKLCGDRQIRQLTVTDSNGPSLEQGDDAREVTFMCVGAPQQSAAQPQTQAR